MTADLSREVVAYNYFDYQQQGVYSIESILSSLLRQFLLQISFLPQSVQKLYDLTRPNQARPSASDVYDVLKTLLRDFHRCFIVIDALDECKDKGIRKALLQDLIGLNGDTIRIFVTCRPPLAEIEQYAKQHPRVTICADERDLKAYCFHMIENDRDILDLLQGNLKNEVVEAVVSQAQGM